MKTKGDSFHLAICLSVFLLAFVAPKVSAQAILPLSQARSVSAGGVSTSAVDFAAFRVSIQSGASANQTSMINSASITASGFAFGNFSTGLGVSRFSVGFDLASNCLYTLSGSVPWSNLDGGSGGGPPFVLLSSTSGTNFYAHGLPFSGGPFSTNGVLPAGEYTLSAQAAAQAFHGENDSYNLTFSVTPVSCSGGQCSPDLVAYWTFDEGSGSIANDSTTNLNTGTIVETGSNSISWVAGLFNGALHFDNQTEVIVSNSPSLNPFDPITITAWVKADSWGSAGHAPRILQKGNVSVQYALFSTPSGQLEFELAGVSGGTLLANAPAIGSWHFVGGTYDGTSISLYIDGQIVAQQPADGALAVTSDLLTIGGDPSGNTSNMFSGSLDDVRIYNGALSPTAILQVYDFDTIGDGVANWWRQQYFGNGSITDANSCAACDVDGTAQNNLFKYVAGLDPTNPSSIFGLDVFLATTNFDVITGLVASYPFTGNLTNDASGNGHNGIAVGGVSLTGDRFGNPNSALHCDGSSGYVYIPAELTTGYPFTWSVWFRPGFTATNLTSTLLNEGGAPEQGGISPALWINQPPYYGAFDFYDFVNPQGANLPSQTRPQWDSNKWYHVAITGDASGNRCLYVNGACEGSSAGQFGQSQTDFYIGASGAYGQNYFAGDIDDVNIYHRALSADEVEQLFAGQANNQPNVQFGPVLAGRTYTPQVNTDLVNGVWQPLGFIGPVTNGNHASVIDTNAPSPAKFYRIDISKP